MSHLRRNAEELIELGALGKLLVRPLESEDRNAYVEFCTRLAPEDVRLRFGRAIRRLSRDFLDELLAIDHDRVEVFAAFDAAGAILGVARVAEHEIALTVRSDLKRRGLGRALLDRLLRHAIEHGMPELEGYVLAENEVMLHLAKRAGFRAMSEGGGSMHISLCLP
jgi:acetyltransferase